MATDLVSPDQPKLDDFLALPKIISEDPTCTDLVAMHYVLAMKLQSEIEHLPLTTLQLILLERTLTTYITIRYRERKVAGTEGGFDLQASSQWQNFWLTCHRELNAQLRLQDRDYKMSYDAKVTAAIKKGLANVPDDVAVLVKESLSKEFAESNL
jgi:hypothetical protein